MGGEVIEDGCLEAGPCAAKHDIFKVAGIFFVKVRIIRLQAPGEDELLQDVILFIAVEGCVAPGLFEAVFCCGLCLPEAGLSVAAAQVAAMLNVRIN